MFVKFRHRIHGRENLGFGFAADGWGVGARWPPVLFLKCTRTLRRFPCERLCFAADGWGGRGDGGGELGGVGDFRVNIGDKYAPRLFFRYKMVKSVDVF